MENNTTLQYLHKLRDMCETIEDGIKYQIFYQTCKRFNDYKRGVAPSKNISKKELMEILINKGYMNYRLDETTGQYTKLPDDRGVRKAIRELLTMGFPIITTSHDNGCFIVENVNEIDKPQKENHARAVSILAVDKGYNLVRDLLSGQQKFLP